MITVGDLAFKAEISPVKAAKFLKKLARQLEIEPEVDETGIIYYVFNTGKAIYTQRQLQEKSQYIYAQGDVVAHPRIVDSV